MAKFVKGNQYGEAKKKLRDLYEHSVFVCLIFPRQNGLRKRKNTFFLKDYVPIFDILRTIGNKKIRFKFRPSLTKINSLSNQAFSHTACFQITGHVIFKAGCFNEG